MCYGLTYWHWGQTQLKSRISIESDPFGTGSVRAGESSINGEQKNDQKEDTLYAMSAGLPVTRTLSIKIIFAKGRTHKEVGSDAENIAVAYIRQF